MAHSQQYRLVIPAGGYKQLNVTFGFPIKNRMILIKRKADFLSLFFNPVVIDKYPNKNFP